MQAYIKELKSKDSNKEVCVIYPKTRVKAVYDDSGERLDSLLNGVKASCLPLTGTAAKATADANGNNIVNTYATKAQLQDYRTKASGSVVAIQESAPADTTVLWAW